MNKFFYNDLVAIETLFEELDTLELNENEKRELQEIAHTHIHQSVIDAVLSHLKEDDKKKFLELLAAGEDGKIWEHLNTRVEKIEDKIKAAAAQTKKELASDIKRIKK